MSNIVERIGNTVNRLLADASASSIHLTVAYSGGVDSSLLLHALANYRDNHSIELSAVHVHHGLSANADAWAQHCELQCRLLDVTFTQIAVNIDNPTRTSLEAQARDERYKALHQYCKDHQSILCLGQHSEDQLETILLQLKRGAGPHGLSGMGECQWRNNILTLRPMLHENKQAILQAANALAIEWVEDESNGDDSYDRNFLRNQILPQLTKRWPQLAKTAGRSAELCAEQSALIDEEGAKKLALCTVSPTQLDGVTLASLSLQWQRVVVRQWFAQNNERAPSQAQLAQVLSMLEAKQDATPEVTFSWGKVARYQSNLYWVLPPKQPNSQEFRLTPFESLPLPWLKLEICWAGNTTLSDTARLTVKTGVKGVKIKPASSRVTKPLKDWFKQWKVPVWERAYVPVIFHGSEPIALVVNQTLIKLANFPASLCLDIKPLVISGGNR